MAKNNYLLKQIGVIHSELTNLADAPRQGVEGGYEAWLELTPQVAPGVAGIHVGDSLIILTWLHQAQRDVLQVHPRGQFERPLTGVFATRSPDRPNPIGLHQVSVLQMERQHLKVAPIEAVDGTPIIDIKPVLTKVNDR